MPAIEAGRQVDAGAATAIILPVATRGSSHSAAAITVTRPAWSSPLGASHSQKVNRRNAYDRSSRGRIGHHAITPGVDTQARIVGQVSTAYQAIE